ncbi:MAG: hypothetical protein QOD99_941 [Chthoniobacter sp.]|jgi:SAM-dependent methyltransferase/predicted Zn-ribbon and HTH transcriptional regulator|nr:hypothetical protein [Chthoniobacter sp.]
MAPELAISELTNLALGSVVLDPMAGSGTVLRHASELGHNAIGFDMDPLAVLMSSVSTTAVSEVQIDRLLSKVRYEIGAGNEGELKLPWIDDDPETREFVAYWFAAPQSADLRRLAHSLFHLTTKRSSPATRVAADVLRVAFSRIIITKDRGASLARDVSHSRPHKVSDASDFEVIPAFERSVNQVRRLLTTNPPRGNVEVTLGDARSLTTVGNATIDAVLTSPPYLNAIDYLRGHRLSLVWLGHRLADLRAIRSCSIGAERGRDRNDHSDPFEEIQEAMCSDSKLLPRHAGMVARYAEDVYRMMSEISRVLKREGRAILVVGNSCLKGTFVRNSAGVVRAGEMVGLRVKSEVERELPIRSRYLPLPLAGDNPLGTRMRTESVISFVPNRR